MDFRWDNLLLSLTDLMAINWQWQNLLFPFLISFCAFSDFQIWPWICAILCVLALLYLKAQKRADQFKHKDQLRQQEMEQSRLWETKLAEECQKLVNLIAEKDEFAQESRDRAVKIVEMEDQLRKLDKQLEDTRQALAESEKSKAKAQEEMNDRLIELENMYKHQQDDLLEMKQCHFDQALAESEKSKAKAHAKLAEECQKLVNLTAEKDAFARESRDRAMRILEMDDQMWKQHKQLEKTMKALADSEQCKSTLKQEVAQLRNRKTELAQSLENVTKMSVERDSLARKERLADLADKEGLQRQLDEMTPKMAEREATFELQMDELRQALTDLEQSKSTLKQETDNLTAERDAFATECQIRDEKIVQMNSVQKLHKQLEDTLQALADWEQSKDTLQQEMEKTCYRRETELAEERKKTAKLTAERNKFARESRDRNKKIGQMDNEMKKQHKQLEDRRETELAEERKKTAKLSAESDAFATVCQVRDKKIGQMNNEMKKLHKQLEDTLQALADSKQSKAKAQEELRVQTTELAKSLENAVKITAERDALAKEKHALLADKKELQRLQALADSKQFKRALKREMDKMHNRRIAEEHKKAAMGYGGQIVFRMPNFKAFSQGRGPAKKVFSPDERINGVPWRIKIKYNNDWIGLYLKCNASTDEIPWLCLAACQFSVVSRTTKSDGCVKGDLDDFDHFFAERSVGLDFAKFEELMHPKNGFYDANSDTITFKAELFVKKPQNFKQLEESKK